MTACAIIAPVKRIGVWNRYGSWALVIWAAVGLGLQARGQSASKGNVVLYTDSIAVLKHAFTAVPDAKGMATIRLPKGTITGSVIVQPTAGGASILPLSFKKSEGDQPLETQASYLYNQRGQRATVDITEGGESATYVGLLEIGSPTADFITIRNERGAQVLPLSRIDHIEITSPIATPRVREQAYTAVSFQTQGKVGVPIPLMVSYAMKGMGWTPSIKAFIDEKRNDNQKDPKQYEADEYYRAVIFSMEEMLPLMSYFGVTRPYNAAGYYEGRTFSLGDHSFTAGEEKKVEFFEKQRRRFTRYDTANIVASTTALDTSWPISTYYLAVDFMDGLVGIPYELYSTTRGPEFYTMVSMGQVYGKYIYLSGLTLSYINIYISPSKKKNNFDMGGTSQILCKFTLHAPKGYVFYHKKEYFRTLTNLDFSLPTKTPIDYYNYELRRDRKIKRAK